MPIDVDIKQPDDGDGIEATLMRHHAGWHKTCHLKFNLTKLRRKITNGTSAVHTCSSHSYIDLKDDKCFFAISLKISTMHLHTYEIDAVH